MRLLYLGDVIGRTGRDAVARHLPDLRRALDLDCVVANGENAAGGFGITETIAKEMFKDGLKAMPPQYLRNRGAMKHFVSVNQEAEFRDTMANRVGALGDASVQGFQPLMAFGVPVEAAQLMPEAKGLFTNPLNLIFGIQRQVSLEFDKDISARVYVVVLTARVCVQIEETDAVVEYQNIGS